MASKRQRSISCSDEDWAAIRQRAEAKSLSVSEYLVICALSKTADEADGSTAIAGMDSVDTGRPALSDAERSAFRAIWFLYTDRLGRMKDAGEQPRIDALIKEARRKFE